VVRALDQNVDLFFNPTQLSKIQPQIGAQIRVGGMVKKNSVFKKEDLNLEFIITDFTHDLKVYYRGLLPDLFKEERGVVVSGRFQSSDVFLADQVLAKHNEYYRPME
jgi:cytochrome c-type biogenesis protein CcmE